MLINTKWTTARALKVFQALAGHAPSQFERRFGWDNNEEAVARFSAAEIDAIYAGVIAKIPAGAAKVLEIGSGDGRFYRALKAARPDLDYRGIDIVAANVDDAQTAKGTVTVAGVQAADTVTLAGVTLTASGSQAATGLDFNETGSDEEVAASLAAAINDTGNGLNASVTADSFGTIVTVRAAAIGTAGNSTALASSEGSRLAVSGSTLSGGLAPGLFEIGNASEYLREATVDWDFVVSINCLFWCTDTTESFPEWLLATLDAKSPKGFFVLGHPQYAALLAAQMPTVLSNSTAVAESYFEGVRDFLPDADLKSAMAPFYVHRDSTSGAVPEDSTGRSHFISRGKWDKVVAQVEGRFAVRRGDPLPTQVTKSQRTGGLITGRTTEAPAENLGLGKMKVRKKRGANAN